MLTMATKQEMYELGRKAFDEFPAWVELNLRYACGPNAELYPIRAVCVQNCYGPNARNAELITSHGNFELSGYGKSWRLWYANGRERPDGKQPWERFSWDT